MIGVTDVLAIYGATLASIGLGWNLYRDLHDRPQVKLDARIRRLGIGEDGRLFAANPNLPVANTSDNVFVCISIVNEGRRPVLITTWGGQWLKPVAGKQNFLIYARGLPKMLTENQEHHEWTDELTPRVEHLKSLAVWDSNDKQWKLSKKALKRLKAESRTIMMEANGGATTGAANPAGGNPQ